MLLQVLRAQWMTARPVIVLGAILAFAIPLGSVYYGGDVATGSSLQVSSWLASSRTVGQAIPVVALALGLLVGMAAWAPDHLGRHVYALTLPIPRWRFVMLRFVSGLVLLAGPVVALAVGAAVASASVDLPPGVHAYPIQLTLRFALSAVVMFAIFFTISIGTRRAVVLTLGSILGLVVADIALGAAGSDAIVVESVIGALTRFPGPLAILLGRWALFDV